MAARSPPSLSLIWACQSARKMVTSKPAPVRRRTMSVQTIQPMCAVPDGSKPMYARGLSPAAALATRAFSSSSVTASTAASRMERNAASGTPRSKARPVIGRGGGQGGAGWQPPAPSRGEEPAWLVGAVLLLFLVGFSAFVARQAYLLAHTAPWSASAAYWVSVGAGAAIGFGAGRLTPVAPGGRGRQGARRWRGPHRH